MRASAFCPLTSPKRFVPYGSKTRRPTRRSAFSTRLQLPATLITEIAIAQLWMSWGVKPDALIGHSMGSYAAACVSGVLSFKSAVELVHLRGRLFTEIPPGGILSVPLAEEELLARLPPDIDVASVNTRSFVSQQQRDA